MCLASIFVHTVIQMTWGRKTKFTSNLHLKRAVLHIFWRVNVSVHAPPASQMILPHCTSLLESLFSLNAFGADECSPQQIHNREEDRPGVVGLAALACSKHLGRSACRTDVLRPNQGPCPKSWFFVQSLFRAQYSKRLRCIFLFIWARSVSAWMYPHPSKLYSAEMIAVHLPAFASSDDQFRSL